MTNIAILGCGMSGMLTALSFASKGIKTTIFERSNLEFPKDPRTTALTNISKTFLKEIGLWHVLKKKVGEIQDIYVADNKAPQIIHLTPNQDECMGYMIENVDLKDALFSATIASSLITLSKGVDYKLEDLQDYDLALVCEGRNSKIREEYFEDKVSKSYGQSAMTLIVRHKNSHEGTAVEHFMTQGVFAILPLRDPHRSSVVWCEKTEVAQLYLEMERKEFTEHLQERFGEFLGRVEVETNPIAFPLSARITKKYYTSFSSGPCLRGSQEFDEILGSSPEKNNRRNFLAVLGDSAHTIHPLAGQGLNQAIKDIDTLTRIVSRNISVGLGVGEIALEEYENKRKRDNFAMYLVTDNLNRFFSNNLPGLSGLRKVWMGIVEEVPILKSWIAQRRGWERNRCSN